jgi:hypothetical protein
MRLTLSAIFVALTLAAATRVPTHAAQSNQAAKDLPPLQYVCPMVQDAEVLEDKPGLCPKCKMQLLPVRLDTKYWCPTHQAAVVKDAPGKCPLDGKDLIQVIVNEYWTCAAEAGSRLTEPGKCTNGQDRKIVFEARAHGDHNPKHDGQLFMGADAWHHIEGTYPSAGLFRLFFYDNFTKSMNAKAFSASLVVFDPKANVDKELGTFPLTLTREGTTMEAKLPAALAGLPLKAAAKVKFDAVKPPQRFDFAFQAYSKDPAPPAAAPQATRPANSTASTTAPKTAPAPAAPKPAASPAAAPRTPAATTAAATPPKQEPAPAVQAPLVLDSPLQMPPGLAEALDESKLPNDVPGLLRELTTRAQEVEKLVNEGSLAQVWLPAVATKTVALLLDTRAGSLPQSQHLQASGAVKRVVTAAWELDAYGDLGDRVKITDAYRRLESAVTDLKAAYGSK